MKLMATYTQTGREAFPPFRGADRNPKTLLSASRIRDSVILFLA